KLREIVRFSYDVGGEQPGKPFALAGLHGRKACCRRVVTRWRRCRTQGSRSRGLAPLPSLAEVLRNLLGEYGRIAAFGFTAVAIATTSITAKSGEHRAVTVCAAGEQWDRERLHVRGGRPKLPQMFSHRRFLVRWQQRGGQKYVRNA